RLAPTMEWDTAAAQIVVEEAGGKVIQAASGEKVIYNKENLLNPHFIVSGQQN
ncbi:MAG: inositol monophosphatase family protein, partial [Bacteroidota bacterium]